MTEVIFLEKVNKYSIGQKVNVASGYARNFLIPKGKALRATKENEAYYESKRANLEKENNEKKSQAEEFAKSIENSTITLVRQAGEDGKLFGSVTSRDITKALSEIKKIELNRSAIELNDPIKSIGLHKVRIALHAEVVIDINIDITRSNDKTAD